MIAAEVVAFAGLGIVLVTLWWAWIEIGRHRRHRRPGASSVWEDISSSPGEYVSATVSHALTAAIALAIGTTVGLIAALVASRVKFLAGMTIPIVVLMAATPLVALFPLFARVFGYQPTTVRLLAAVMVFYPVFVYTRSGLQAANPAGPGRRGRPRRQSQPRFRSVVLPSAVPAHRQRLPHRRGHGRHRRGGRRDAHRAKGLGVEFSSAYNQLHLPRAFGAALVVVGTSLVVFALAGKFEQPSTTGGHEQAHKNHKTQEVQMNQRYDRRLFLSGQPG